MARHDHRASLAVYRREADALLTYLVPPDDPALNGLLKETASAWLDLLTTRCRHCIICSTWMVDRQHVGWLLLSTPAMIRPRLASVSAICRECADLPMPVLERAATIALREAVPGGRFIDQPDASP